MNHKKPQDRWDALTIVLQFDSQYERVFTPFERMYLHKERATLLQDKNFEQPQELEDKIQQTLQRIERIEWECVK